jgi:hypothetical protein
VSWSEPAAHRADENAVSEHGSDAERYFQRKWTNTLPKLSESFSTRW